MASKILVKDLMSTAVEKFENYTTVDVIVKAMSLQRQKLRDG